MSLMKLNKIFLPLFALSMTGVASAYTIPVKRKYQYTSRLKDPTIGFAMVFETSIYDMFENSENDVDRKNIQEPVVEVMNDLTFLERAQLVDDPQIAAKWKMKGSQGRNWLEFIGDRIFAITAGDETQESFWTTRFRPTLPLSPEAIENLNVYRNLLLGAAKQTSPSAIARNLGVNLAHRAWQSGYAYSYERDTYQIDINGLRPSIIKVSPSFFSNTGSLKLFGEHIDPATLRALQKIERLATLVHEARHSDGTEISFGFFHSVCPANHAYAGLPRCDRSQNGPYAAEADFFLQVSKTCKANSSLYPDLCSDFGIDMLTGSALEARSLLLDKNIYPNDANGIPVVETLSDSQFLIPGRPSYVKLVSSKDTPKTSTKGKPDATEPDDNEEFKTLEDLLDRRRR